MSQVAREVSVMLGNLMYGTSRRTRMLGRVYANRINPGGALLPTRLIYWSKKMAGKGGRELLFTHSQP